jgi:hypothetical protein
MRWPELSGCAAIDKSEIRDRRSDYLLQLPDNKAAILRWLGRVQMSASAVPPHGRSGHFGLVTWAAVLTVSPINVRRTLRYTAPLASQTARKIIPQSKFKVWTLFDRHDDV